MTFNLRRLAKRRNAAVIDEIYGEIVAAARQPAFYADFGVPDTPLGRFEMLSLHMFLLMERSRGTADAALAGVVQETVDEFFKDVDHSLRELGIGDMGVPKRMKKLARMFYGRCQSYGEALTAGDTDALATALKRNVRPDIAVEAAWAGAEPLARYAEAALAGLKGQGEEALAAGTIAFPAAGAAGASR